MTLDISNNDNSNKMSDSLRVWIDGCILYFIYKISYMIDFVYRIATGNILVNPFYTVGFFLYPLKTWESQKFSDVFRGYKNRSVAKICNLLLRISNLAFLFEKFPIWYNFYTRTIRIQNVMKKQLHVFHISSPSFQ